MELPKTTVTVGSFCSLLPGEIAEGRAARHEDLVLVGKVRSARLGEVNERQPVGVGDLREAAGLGHRQLRHRAAFHRRLVGRHQALDRRHAADAADDPRSGGVGFDLVAGQRAQLEERGVAVEDELHPLPGEELASRPVPLVVLGAPASARAGERCLDVLPELPVGLGVGGEGRPLDVDVRTQHGVPLLMDPHGASVEPPSMVSTTES